MNKLSFNSNKYIFFFSLLIICALHLFLKLDHFSPEVAINGFHSDNAIYLIMAEELLRGESFPIYYYGQNYMGPLNVWFIALNQLILNNLGIEHFTPFFNDKFFISPLASILALTEMVILGALFLAMGVRKLYSNIDGLIVFSICLFSHEVMADMALRPNGPENAFLIGSVLFYLFTNSTFDLRNKNSGLLFGFISALGWWFNQSIVFILLAILIYQLLKQDDFQSLKSEIFYWYKSLDSKASKIFTYLAVFGFLLGIAFSFPEKIDTRFLGIKLKMSSGFGTMKIAIGLFVISHLVILFKSSKYLFFKMFGLFKENYQYFFLTFFITFLPIALGKYFGLYEPAYKPKIQIIPLVDSLSYWYRVFIDFIPRLFFPYNFKIPYLFPLLNIFIICFYILKNKDQFKFLTLKKLQSKKSFFALIFVTNILFVMISERTRDQYALRYALFLIPFSWIYLRDSLNFKGLHYLILILLLSSGIKSYQAREILLAERNSNYINPRMLNSLECGAIKTDYWLAYINEYIYQHRFKFIVHKSQDRTPKLTKSRSNLKPICIFEENSLKLFK